jgi:hypothetical protein
MKQRVIASRKRLAAMPSTGPDQPGPPDPKTGERWDRYNVLGHMAEILPYWIGELSVAIESGVPVGRQPGSAERQAGIQGGRAVGEAKLREQVDAGLADLVIFLGRLSPRDLERTIEMRNRGEQPMRWALENLLVAHVEEHCSQLTELAGTAEP